MLTKIVTLLLIVNAASAGQVTFKQGGASCYGSPCQNGGTCWTPVMPATSAPVFTQPPVFPPVCSCPPGFVGPNCNVPVTPQPVTMAPMTTTCAAPVVQTTTRPPTMAPTTTCAAPVVQTTTRPPTIQLLFNR